MKILFKDAIIITMNDKNDILKGDVFVDGNTIQKIGKVSGENFDRVIDCKGKALMPGFINTHCHLAMSLFRGIGENTNFNNWWHDNMRPLEEQCSDEDFYNGVKLGLLECIQNGITSVVDLYMANNMTAKAMKELGVRGWIGVGAITGSEVLDEKYLDAEIDKIKKTNNDVKPILYAHSIYSCDESQYAELVKYSKKHNLTITTHLSETLKEVGECYTKYQMTPVELLESYGVLDRNTLLAHCVHCDKDDVQIMKNYNVNVTSCPSSNLIIGSGIAPIYSYTKNNINVCVSTDGAASNNSLDMFKEMFLLDNLQSGVLNQPFALTTLETLRSATINGAKALGEDKLGKIEKGCFADIILLDLTLPNALPINNLINNVVNSMGTKNVCLTMVNGNILYENNQFLIDNADKIKQNAIKSIKNLKI